MFLTQVHLFSKHLLSSYMASPYQLIFFPQKQTQDFIQGVQYIIQETTFPKFPLSANS